MLLELQTFLPKPAFLSLSRIDDWGAPASPCWAPEAEGIFLFERFSTLVVYLRSVVVLGIILLCSSKRRRKLKEAEFL